MGASTVFYFVFFFKMWPMGGMEILSSTQPALYIFYFILFLLISYPTSLGVSFPKD
jgi:hypothetical protein